MKRNELIATLEIGTSRIAMAVAKPLGDGIEVLSICEVESVGVRKSKILEVEQVRHAIEKLLKELDDKCRLNIKHVDLVVTGLTVETSILQYTRPLNESKVLHEDIRACQDIDNYPPMPQSRYTLEVGIKHFEIGETIYHSAPVGFSGNYLSAYALFVHDLKDRINIIKEIAKGLDLTIDEVSFAGNCAATSVLTKQNKNDGVVVIDLGGGTTSFTVWVEGCLVMADVIGVGGDHVTGDIRTAFNVNKRIAEELKVKYSSAMVNNIPITERVEIENDIAGFPKINISRKALNTVVNARLKELFMIIRAKLDAENWLQSLNVGVFLTGGGAAQQDIVPLARKELGLNVQLATLLCEIKGMDNNDHPERYAVLLGSLLARQKLSS